MEQLMEQQREKEMGEMLRPIFIAIGDIYADIVRTIERFVETFGDVEFCDDCIVYGDKQFLKLQHKDDFVVTYKDETGFTFSDIPLRRFDLETLESLALTLSIRRKYNKYSKPTKCLAYGCNNSNRLDMLYS